MTGNIKRLAKFVGGTTNIVGAGAVALTASWVIENDPIFAHLMMATAGGMVIGGSILIKQSITDK